MGEVENICPECDRTDDCTCDAGINPKVYTDKGFRANFEKEEGVV